MGLLFKLKTLYQYYKNLFFKLLSWFKIFKKTVAITEIKAKNFQSFGKVDYNIFIYTKN